MDKKKLLETKAALKKRQPTFVRSEPYLARLKKTWRRPKGLHNKLGKKGNRAALHGGYQTPKAVRGLTKEGLEPVLITQVASLDAIDKNTQCVIVGNVGGKKRIAIIEEAGKKELVLHNASAETASALKEQFAQRSKQKASQKQEREQRNKKLEEKLKKDKKKDELEKVAEAEAKDADKKKADASQKSEEKAPEQEKKQTPQNAEKPNTDKTSEKTK